MMAQDEEVLDTKRTIPPEGQMPLNRSRKVSVRASHGRFLSFYSPMSEEYEIREWRNINEHTPIQYSLNMTNSSRDQAGRYILDTSLLFEGNLVRQIQPP